MFLYFDLINDLLFRMKFCGYVHLVEFYKKVGGYILSEYFIIAKNTKSYFPQKF